MTVDDLVLARDRLSLARLACESGCALLADLDGEDQQWGDAVAFAVSAEEKLAASQREIECYLYRNGEN